MKALVLFILLSIIVQTVNGRPKKPKPSPVAPNDLLNMVKDSDSSSESGHMAVQLPNTTATIHTSIKGKINRTNSVNYDNTSITSNTSLIQANHTSIIPNTTISKLFNKSSKDVKPSHSHRNVTYPQKSKPHNNNSTKNSTNIIKRPISAAISHNKTKPTQQHNNTIHISNPNKHGTYDPHRKPLNKTITNSTKNNLRDDKFKNASSSINDTQSMPISKTDNNITQIDSSRNSNIKDDNMALDNKIEKTEKSNVQPAGPITRDKESKTVPNINNKIADDKSSDGDSKLLTLSKGNEVKGSGVGESGSGIEAGAESKPETSSDNDAKQNGEVKTPEQDENAKLSGDSETTNSESKPSETTSPKSAGDSEVATADGKSKEGAESKTDVEPNKAIDAKPPVEVSSTSDSAAIKPKVDVEGDLKSAETKLDAKPSVDAEGAAKTDSVEPKEGENDGKLGSAESTPKEASDEPKPAETDVKPEPTKADLTTPKEGANDDSKHVETTDIKKSDDSSTDSTATKPSGDGEGEPTDGKPETTSEATPKEDDKIKTDKVVTPKEGKPLKTSKPDEINTDSKTVVKDSKPDKVAKKSDAKADDVKSAETTPKQANDDNLPTEGSDVKTNEINPKPKEATIDPKLTKSKSVGSTKVPPKKDSNSKTVEPATKHAKPNGDKGTNPAPQNVKGANNANPAIAKHSTKPDEVGKSTTDPVVTKDQKPVKEGETKPADTKAVGTETTPKDTQQAENDGHTTETIETKPTIGEDSTDASVNAKPSEPAETGAKSVEVSDVVAPPSGKEVTVDKSTNTEGGDEPKKADTPVETTEGASTDATPKVEDNEGKTVQEGDAKPAGDAAVAPTDGKTDSAETTPKEGTNDNSKPSENDAKIEANDGSKPEPADNKETITTDGKTDSSETTPKEGANEGNIADTKVNTVAGSKPAETDDAKTGAGSTDSTTAKPDGDGQVPINGKTESTADANDGKANDDSKPAKTTDAKSAGDDKSVPTDGKTDSTPNEGANDGKVVDGKTDSADETIPVKGGNDGSKAVTETKPAGDGKIVTDEKTDSTPKVGEGKVVDGKAESTETDGSKPSETTDRSTDAKPDGDVKTQLPTDGITDSTPKEGANDGKVADAAGTTTNDGPKLVDANAKPVGEDKAIPTEDSTPKEGANEGKVADSAAETTPAKGDNDESKPAVEGSSTDTKPAGDDKAVTTDGKTDPSAETTSKEGANDGQVDGKSNSAETPRKEMTNTDTKVTTDSNTGAKDVKPYGDGEGSKTEMPKEENEGPKSTHYSKPAETVNLDAKPTSDNKAPTVEKTDSPAESTKEVVNDDSKPAGESKLQEGSNDKTTDTTPPQTSDSKLNGNDETKPTDDSKPDTVKEGSSETKPTKDTTNQETPIDSTSETSDSKTKPKGGIIEDPVEAPKESIDINPNEDPQTRGNEDNGDDSPRKPRRYKRDPLEGDRRSRSTKPDDKDEENNEDRPRRTIRRRGGDDSSEEGSSSGSNRWSSRDRSSVLDRIRSRRNRTSTLRSTRTKDSEELPTPKPEDEEGKDTNIATQPKPPIILNTARKSVPDGEGVETGIQKIDTEKSAWVYKFALFCLPCLIIPTFIVYHWHKKVKEVEAQQKWEQASQLNRMASIV